MKKSSFNWSYLIFDLVANEETTTIDECNSSQIYPENSGVF